MTDSPKFPPHATVEESHGVARRDAMRFFNRASLAVFACVVALYVAARLWRLTDSCLWFDEVFSIHAAGLAWGEMLRFVAADVIHPPLFYALLKVWTALGGESLLWLRLLPVLISVAGIVPFLFLCRELGLKAGEMNLALLLLAVNGYLIKYAQEVRMYAPLFTLSVTSLWLCARFLNTRAAGGQRKTLVALFVVNLLLVYTHYYGWLVVASEFAYLLARERRQLMPFSLSLAALVAGFMPWVYTVARVTAVEDRGVTQNLGWIARPTLADVGRFLALLNEPFYFRQSNVEPLHTRISVPLGLALFGVPFVILIFRRLRRQGDDDADANTTGRLCFLLFFLLFPLLLAFVLSRVLPLSVWGTRHLIIVAAPYALLACVGLWRLRPVWLKQMALVVLAGWFALVCAVVAARREGVFIWCAWDTLARDAAVREAGAEQEVKVYAFEELVAYHLWFALERGREGKYKVAVVKNVPGIAEDPAYFLPRGFEGVRVVDASALEGERFLVAFRDAAWRESRPPLKILLERGYLVEDVREFAAQGQRAFLVSVRRESER